MNRTSNHLGAALHNTATTTSRQKSHEEDEDLEVGEEHENSIQAGV